jgi:hypothetical protein
MPYLNATSQNIKLIIIARKKIVPKKDNTKTLFSYFKCMKNIKTRLPFMDAIHRAIHTLNWPRSTNDIPTVIQVKSNNPASTMAWVLYSIICE